MVCPSSRRGGDSASRTASAPPTRSTAATSRACTRAERCASLTGSGSGAGERARPRQAPGPRAARPRRARGAVGGRRVGRRSGRLGRRRGRRGLDRSGIALADLGQPRVERPPVPLGGRRPAALGPRRTPSAELPRRGSWPPGACGAPVGGGGRRTAPSAAAAATCGARCRRATGGGSGAPAVPLGGGAAAAASGGGSAAARLRRPRAVRLRAERLRRRGCGGLGRCSFGRSGRRLRAVLGGVGSAGAAASGGGGAAAAGGASAERLRRRRRSRRAAARRFGGRLRPVVRLRPDGGLGGRRSAAAARVPRRGGPRPARLPRRRGVGGRYGRQFGALSAGVGSGAAGGSAGVSSGGAGGAAASGGGVSCLGSVVSDAIAGFQPIEGVRDEVAPTRPRVRHRVLWGWQTAMETPRASSS